MQVPPGVLHAIAPAGPARYLTLHAPASGFGAFLRALAEDGDEERAAARSGFDQTPAR
jgi:hypothetical protein